MNISVYITSYNQKEYLVEAVESVLAQTLRPSQVIIIDDCSKDGSRELIAGYVSKYPDLIEGIYHTENQGVTKTRIDALAAVTGDYVTYVDGDDRILPSKLEQEALTLQKNPNARISFSNYYYITAEGNRITTWANESTPPQGDIFLQAFSREFPRDSLFRSELVHSSCLKEIDLYDPNLKIYEDWDLKIRLTKHFHTVYCPSPLSEYRQNPDGLSRANAALHLKTMETIFKKNYSLLNDLNSTQKKSADQKINIILSALAKRAAQQSYESQDFLKVLKYVLDFSGYRLNRSLLQITS